MGALQPHLGWVWSKEQQITPTTQLSSDLNLLTPVNADCPPTCSQFLGVKYRRFVTDLQLLTPNVQGILWCLYEMHRTPSFSVVFSA